LGYQVSSSREYPYHRTRYCHSPSSRLRPTIRSKTYSSSKSGLPSSFYKYALASRLASEVSIRVFSTFGVGAGVTRSDDTRTSSSPRRSRNVLPSVWRIRYGPSTWASSLGFTPTSWTSRRRYTQEPGGRSLFFSRTPRSYLCLYRVWASASRFGRAVGAP
jgi:hypothetical protein